MFKNYFKTAWRNVKRNKVNSFLNITGLAIGMSMCDNDRHVCNR
jgi:putative ABC transport system permease protein